MLRAEPRYLDGHQNAADRKPAPWDEAQPTQTAQQQSSPNVRTRGGLREGLLSNPGKKAEQARCQDGVVALFRRSSKDISTRVGVLVSMLVAAPPIFLCVFSSSLMMSNNWVSTLVLRLIESCSDAALLCEFRSCCSMPEMSAKTLACLSRRSPNADCVACKRSLTGYAWKIAASACSNCLRNPCLDSARPGNCGPRSNCATAARKDFAVHLSSSVPAGATIAWPALRRPHDRE